MNFLNKLCIILGISLLLVLIFRIVIPGYKEVTREKKITQNDVNKYKSNSRIIDVLNYKLLSKLQQSEIYFDGTPFIKKMSYRTIAILQDLDTEKIYKIEIYKDPGIISLYFSQANNLQLLIYKKSEQAGTLADPIIALKYASTADLNYEVNDDEYLYNIREYLTYRNYTPPETGTFSYCLTLAWILISIFGFAITTGVLNKKMHRIEQEKFKTNESLNKGADK